ncbi:MAG: LPS assembly lipoprotein LptE [candidate division WOR-3 bacterium]|nr:LPS assembly lipoprotein LptE [candidate division WOR-3 bacterium]
MRIGKVYDMILIKKSVATVCLVSAILMLSCCGYSTRSLMPGYMQKIYIGILENRTLKPGLDELATNTVIEAFRSGSSLRIVDEGSADLVLEGSVSGFSKDPYTYTSDQTILQYKITVRYSMRCVDKVRNEVFWEGDVSDWALYDTDEEQGIREAAKKAAERLVTNILTNW